ncbi:MAG: sulfatase, partial [Candidatus Aminicenantes bacterium]|nr:sulfatase [Candidatus Aminicenantes bacterium]
RQPPSVRSLATAGSDSRPNVVFVVMDTGRKDRYSLYGHSRPTTPRIAELAADGAAFENAYTVSPWTLPSHASMFTGLYPSQHRADNTEDERRFGRPLTPEALTLAEILRAEGYQTAALTANHGVMNASFGLAQGFDVYFDERPYVFDLLTVHLMARADEKLMRKLGINAFYLSSELNGRVFSWLEKNRASSFFLFLNYMEPHGVFYLPPPAGGRFGAPARPPFVPTEAILEGRTTIAPEAYEALATRYDEELAFCDAGLGRLVDRLKQLNLYDRSLIIVTSDHGQVFGEHQFFGHRSVLFEEILEIPLIIKYPRGSAPRSDPAKPIENRELFFLLLEELGIPSPRPPLRAFQDAEGAIYTMAEAFAFPVGVERHLERFSGTRVSITRHVPPRPKLILSSLGGDELYILDEDPREQRNRIQDRAQLAVRLRDAWASWQPALRREALAAGADKEMTQDLKERLRSLGYLVK